MPFSIMPEGQPLNLPPYRRVGRRAVLLAVLGALALAGVARANGAAFTAVTKAEVRQAKAAVITTWSAAPFTAQATCKAVPLSSIIACSVEQVYNGRVLTRGTERFSVASGRLVETAHTGTPQYPQGV